MVFSVVAEDSAEDNIADIFRNLKKNARVPTLLRFGRVRFTVSLLRGRQTARGYRGGSRASLLALRRLAGKLNCMNRVPLTRDEAVRRLEASEREIRALGVERLALFGSVLRNEARPGSDVDLLVTFFPAEKSFLHLLALADLLEERLGCRVELVTMESLSPFLGPRILAEAEDVLPAA